MVVSKRPLGSDGEGAVVYIEGPVVWTMSDGPVGPDVVVVWMLPVVLVWMLPVDDAGDTCGASGVGLDGAGGGRGLDAGGGTSGDAGVGVGRCPGGAAG